MVNGLHLYCAFIDPMATKALYNIASHSPIHSLIHTPAAVSAMQGDPARREQLGFGVLLKDTSTLGQVEPGIEPPSGL